MSPSWALKMKTILIGDFAWFCDRIDLILIYHYLCLLVHIVVCICLRNSHCKIYFGKIFCFVFICVFLCFHLTYYKIDILCLITVAWVLTSIKRMCNSFITPWNASCHPLIVTPFPTSGNHLAFLHHYNSNFLRMSYQWNYFICNLLKLAYFTHNIFLPWS